MREAAPSLGERGWEGVRLETHPVERCDRALAAQRPGQLLDHGPGIARAGAGGP